MGFDLIYSTTEIISPALQREMIADAQALYAERTWVQCDGPDLLDDKGYLTGSSRLSPSDPDGFAEAKASNKPTGKLRDLLTSLCNLSGRHGVTWEISHDQGDVGLIEYGLPDERVTGTFEGLAAMLDGMGDLPDDLRDMLE